MAYLSGIDAYRLADLSIRQAEIETQYQDADCLKCIDCGMSPAPLGLDREHEILQWAEANAAIAPLRRKLGIPSLRNCAVCASQLSLVVGIPQKMLYRLLNRLNGVELGETKSFIETRFVFPMCANCIESSNEDSIALEQIEGRFHRSRQILRDQMAPGAIRAAANHLLNLLREDVRIREAS